MTGRRAVHAVMVAARLEGPQASPKGLRHGFGVAAVSAGIPLNLVQKWLGHAQLTTTQIYLTPRKEDVIRRILAHHTEQARQAAARARPAPAPGYRPGTLDVLFGDQTR